MSPDTDMNMDTVDCFTDFHQNLFKYLVILGLPINNGSSNMAAVRTCEMRTTLAPLRLHQRKLACSQFGKM